MIRSGLSTRFLAALTLVAGVFACSAEPEEEALDDGSEDALVGDATMPDSQPALLVKDPRTLMAIEDEFSFASMVGAPSAAKSGADLDGSSAAYRVIEAAVTSDVAGIKNTDRSAGKGIAFSHRLFQDEWMKSPNVRFELIGIANRIDLSFRGGCGEIHFVYRLAYSTVRDQSRIDSRLPFTVNVLVPMPDDGQRCQAVAQSWLSLSGANDVARALRTGPLSKRAKPSRIEIDFQSVRWPSTTRDDMGGHAEYTLRAFAFDPDDALAPVALDDTPRADLDAAGKSALIDWIRDNTAAIDRGTARLPERFLATTAVSVAPRAAARLGNRPFSALVSDADLAGIDLAATTTTKTPRALLHKLDGITCDGCHQSRGIAGFHLLGEERKGTLRLNALHVGASPHLLDALVWREENLRAVAAGGASPKRNAPDHASGRPGAYGAHCSLGLDPGFSDYTCAPGLSCKRVDDDVLGHCFPTGTPGYGDACEDSIVTKVADAHADSATSRELACAGGATCFLRSGRGFPDGMCQKRCERVGERLGDGTLCAGIPFGSGPLGGFNKCLFELKRPFAECLADDVRPTTSRACDENNPCRDDYACARVFSPQGDDAKTGACVPPYFVFQGRVDGHTL